MSSFLKQSFYNTCFIIKYNNRFVNRICKAQTRKIIELPYHLVFAPQRAHKQYVLKLKSVTLFRFIIKLKKHNQFIASCCVYRQRFGVIYSGIRYVLCEVSTV